MKLLKSINIIYEIVFYFLFLFLVWLFVKFTKNTIDLYFVREVTYYLIFLFFFAGITSITIRALKTEPKKNLSSSFLFGFFLGYVFWLIFCYTESHENYSITLVLLAIIFSAIVGVFVGLIAIVWSLFITFLAKIFKWFPKKNVSSETENESLANKE